MYWEKLKELKYLTFWLHTIADTLVGVENPLVVEKLLEKDHLFHFSRIFFISIEYLYCYFVISTALSLPQCGTIEFALVMVFNGITSRNYVRFVNEDCAIKIFILWTVSACILLLCILNKRENN